MKIKQELPLQQPLKGKTWIEEYNSLLKKANKRKIEIQSSLSQYDSEQDDILHHLEMIKCDAITSSKLIKALKEIRAKRSKKYLFKIMSNKFLKRIKNQVTS